MVQRKCGALPHPQHVGGREGGASTISSAECRQCLLELGARQTQCLKDA
jgi:hypothetical protein